MTLTRRSVLALTLAVAGCAAAGQPPGYESDHSALHPHETPELRRMIVHYARLYDVPPSLVHRVIWRESRYNPDARHGPYVGLMQILPATARKMGYRGSARGLLDPDTNLRYGVKYLRGAWLLSHGNQERAISYYARGYYYEAKRRGMLSETGLI